MVKAKKISNLTLISQREVTLNNNIICKKTIMMMMNMMKEAKMEKMIEITNFDLYLIDYR